MRRHSKYIPLAGNQTLISGVAGENSTTVVSMLLEIKINPAQLNTINIAGRIFTHCTHQTFPNFSRIHELIYPRISENSLNIAKAASSMYTQKNKGLNLTLL